MAFIASILLLSPAAFARATVVNQLDIDAIARFEKKMETAAGSLQSAHSQASITVSLTAMRVAIEELTRHQFSTKLGADYTVAIHKYRDAVESLKQPLADLTKAATSGDETATDAAYQKFATALQKADAQMTTATDEANKAVEKANSSQGAPYLWVLIGAAVFAVGAMIWAFMKREATPEITKHRRLVGLASLWPLLGAGITYGTFMFADQSGGKFHIMYGLVIFGVIAFFNAIGHYNKVRKVGETTDQGQTPPSASKIS